MDGGSRPAGQGGREASFLGLGRGGRSAIAGPTAGKVIDPDEFQRMLSLYYRKRGWDENGVPRPGLEAQFQ